MAKKKDSNYFLEMLVVVVYWAFYLTATMALFERFAIHPETVPGGIFGWTFIVELPRAIVGFFIMGVATVVIEKIQKSKAKSKGKK